MSEMNLDAQKLLVRQFYEKYGDYFYEKILDKKCENFTLPFERIASVRLGELSPLEVEIEKINQYKYIPKSIIEKSSTFVHYFYHW